MPTVEVAGRAVFYLGGPGGSPDPLPIVCLHGAGGSAAMWTQLRIALGRERAVYALDLPGHGRSASVGGPVSIEAYAHAVRQFLDAAGFARPALVGHSMGGAVALRLAIDAPDRVAGLVLVGTAARLRVAPEIFDAVSRDFEAAVERICRLCYGPSTPPDLLARGVAEMRKTAPAVLEADFRACDRFDARDRLGEIQVPTVVLVGDEDLMTPPRYATLLAGGIAGAELRVFRGVGHMLPVETPGPFGAAAETFVSRLSRR